MAADVKVQIGRTEAVRGHVDAVGQEASVGSGPPFGRVVREGLGEIAEPLAEIPVDLPGAGGGGRKFREARREMEEEGGSVFAVVFDRTGAFGKDLPGVPLGKL